MLWLAGTVMCVVADVPFDLASNTVVGWLDHGRGSGPVIFHGVSNTAVGWNDYRARSAPVTFHRSSNTEVGWHGYWRGRDP